MLVGTLIFSHDIDSISAHDYLANNAPIMPDLTGLTTEGPLARSVADPALLLDVMTGNQPDLPADYHALGAGRPA